MSRIDRGNVAVILVRTLSSGNIGAVARAMTNMGFNDLRLVTPVADHLDGQARALAHGANTLLEAAKIFASLQQATADCSLLVASSHKPRRNSQESLPARELGPRLLPYCRFNKVALIFGPENHGLTNDEINRCTWVTNIPAACSYPSLNLAQAVMLLCYELFMTDASPAFADLPALIGQQQLDLFLQYVNGIIELAGFQHKNKRPSVFLGILRRIFTRTGLEPRDLKVLYKLFDQFEKIARERFGQQRY